MGQNVKVCRDVAELATKFDHRHSSIGVIEEIICADGFDAFQKTQAVNEFLNGYEIEETRVEKLREMLRCTRKTVRLKVKEVKTLQNACKKYKAKQEALEFQLKVSIRHAEELDEELEAEVAENEQLRKALEKVMEVEAPIMEGWETSAYKIARQALCGESHE